MSTASYRQALLWADASVRPAGVSPEWTHRLAEAGIEEAVVLTDRPLASPGTLLALRFVEVEADPAGDLLTAYRAARRLLTGPFAAAALGHPHIALIPALTAFHRRRGGPAALLLSPADESARWLVLTDERSRIVRYAPGGQQSCGWQDAGLYAVGSEIPGLLKKEAARFPDLCRHWLSDAIPFYGMKMTDELL